MPTEVADRDVEEPDITAMEASLAAFDVEADMESIVPMPPSIPRALQQVLTKAFTSRFEFYADLDVWLHLPHPALGAETPFERLVAGDGWSVLRALVGARATRVEPAGHPRGDHECKPVQRLSLVP